MNTSVVLPSSGLQLLAATPELIKSYTCAGNNEYMTLSLDQAQSVVKFDNDGYTGCGIYIPENATADFPLGTRINIVQAGLASAVIKPVSVNVTMACPAYSSPSSLQIYGQWSEVTLLKVDTNKWVVNGDII